MTKMRGLGKLGRSRLGALLRKSSSVVTVEMASEVLQISRIRAAQLLASWAKNGWVKRVSRGAYISVPIDAISANVAIEDSWVVASKLYSPCYIGGWTAANYWDLTEQIFNSIILFTTKNVRGRRQKLGNATIWIRTVQPSSMFGLKTEWRQNTKVNVSDPTRTLVDIFDTPAVGGGLVHCVDILNSYLRSGHKDLNLLFGYTQRAKNKTIFKRLGFLMEQIQPNETKFISQCQRNLSAGYSKLDPEQESEKIITRWKLWIPKGWSEKRHR